MLPTEQFLLILRANSNFSKYFEDGRYLFLSFLWEYCIFIVDDCLRVYISLFLRWKEILVFLLFIDNVTSSIIPFDMIISIIESSFRIEF